MLPGTLEEFAPGGLPSLPAGCLEFNVELTGLPRLAVARLIMLINFRTILDLDH